MASEIRLAIGSVRIFGAFVTASVGRSEAEITSAVNVHPGMRAAQLREVTP